MTHYLHKIYFFSPTKPKEKEKYPEWSMQDSAADIVHLTDDNFAQVAAETEEMMIYFHSLSKCTVQHISIYGVVFTIDSTY